MADALTASTQRRTVISIDVFDIESSEVVQALLERRRRMLLPLPPNKRRRLKALSNNSAPSRSVVTWTAFSPNGRRVAASAQVFSDETSAACSAVATMASVDDIEVLKLRASAEPSHGWAMAVDGVPRVIPVRYFATRRSRDSNLASALASLRGGMIVSPRPGQVSHHGLPPNGALERIDAADIGSYVRFEPLNMRGPLRPIKPIMRPYAERARRTLPSLPREVGDEEQHGVS